MASANTASGADWPQGRGPQRSGVSNETGLLKEWPEERPKADLADQGLAMVTRRPRGRDENLPAEQQGTGQRIRPGALGAGWQAGLDNADRQGRNPDQNPSYPAARSTPTIDGELLYALGSDGDLALSRQLPEKFAGRRTFAMSSAASGRVGLSESPLVDGDVVVVTPGGEKATLCIEQEDRRPHWKSAAPGGDPGYASAIVVQGAGRSSTCSS